MDRKMESKYSEIFLNAYQEGIFKIIWGKTGVSIAIDSKRKDMIPEIKDEEFSKYTESIVRLVMDLVEGKEIDEENKKNIETARGILDNEYDIKNHLYIKRNSKIGCFNFLEYEIISHRNEDKPTVIEATSAILKMVIEKEGSETSYYTFEASRRDLKDMIDKLVELKDKMDML